MPCYNRAHDLKRVLEAYDGQTTQEPFELIAVDDCSKDDTFKVLSSYQPKHYELRVERLEKNSGPAAARNRGIPLVRSPLLAFVGDDILPGADFVEKHIDAHQHYSQKEAAILGKVKWPADFPCNTLMTHIDGIGAQQFSYHYMVGGQAYDFRHLYTANVSLKTEMVHLEQTWFDTSFPFAAFEDVEFAYRLSKHGLKIIYQDSIVADHYHYHNIWTFSERQYKSGLMANVLVKKHPELNKLFRTPYKQLFLLAFQPRRVFANHPDFQAEWAEEFTLRLVSNYEWIPNMVLDRWYLAILQYFYFKGILNGAFGRSALWPKIQNTYCLNYLLPQLVRPINQAVCAGVSLPDFISFGDIEKINAFLV